MNLPVNPVKVLRLFAPLWGLLALSLWIHWERWQNMPILLATIACLPVVAAFASMLTRERWRLELTPEALIHHTLGGQERFEWSRMGPLQTRRAPVSALLFLRTFWFAFPLDAPRTMQEQSSKHLGRRLICVFGDRSAAETIQQIEDWRAMYAGRV